MNQILILLQQYIGVLNSINYELLKPKQNKPTWVCSNLSNLIPISNPKIQLEL